MMIPVYAILRKTQKELHEYLLDELTKYYPTTVISEKRYILARGDIPIMLVAHLDTVYPDYTRHTMQIYYDRSQQVMWSPDGLGADDRAGVILILKILEAGYRPHVLFTHDEEIGGIGALDFSFDFDRLKLDIRYMIQLDRMGYEDCVFYSCGNEEFIDYVESFGFIWSYGTFSDISTLMPETRIAGVNLSVGYLEEHSEAEHWHLNWANQTYNKVLAMLSAPPAEPFKYIKEKGVYEGWETFPWIKDDKTPLM